MNEVEGLGTMSAIVVGYRFEGTLALLVRKGQRVARA